jgi:hypothetical protein
MSKLLAEAMKKHTQSAGQQQRVEFALVHRFDLITAERHPDTENGRRHGENFEEQTEVVEHHHAVKQPAGRRAI